MLLTNLRIVGQEQIICSQLRNLVWAGSPHRLQLDCVQHMSYSTRYQSLFWLKNEILVQQQ